MHRSGAPRFIPDQTRMPSLLHKAEHLKPRGFKKTRVNYTNIKLYLLQMLSALAILWEKKKN